MIRRTYHSVVFKTFHYTITPCVVILFAILTKQYIPRNLYKDYVDNIFM